MIIKPNERGIDDANLSQIVANENRTNKQSTACSNSCPKDLQQPPYVRLLVWRPFKVAITSSFDIVYLGINYMNKKESK